MTQAESPWTLDELNLIVEGRYYGHPNRNRARFDPRQCVFHPPSETSSLDYTGPAALLPISADGIVEYASDEFARELEGNLFVASWSTDVVTRIVLSPDGSSVEAQQEVADDFDGSVDITMGPDGVLYVAQFGSGTIGYLVPGD
jgi:glucose/arabinose dehydrogenase